MFNLGNLGGTMVIGGEPIFKFKFKKDRLVSVKVYTDDKIKLPIEFWDRKPNEFLVRMFFEERIVPETRIGLMEYFHERGLKYYDPEAIIRYQCGRTIDDELTLIADDDIPRHAWRDGKALMCVYDPITKSYIDELV